MLSFIASAIRSVFSPRDFGAFQLMVSRLSSYLMLSSASKSFDFAGIIGAITMKRALLISSSADVLMILRLLAWHRPCHQILSAQGMIVGAGS